MGRLYKRQDFDEEESQVHGITENMTKSLEEDAIHGQESSNLMEGYVEVRDNTSTLRTHQLTDLFPDLYPLQTQVMDDDGNVVGGHASQKENVQSALSFSTGPQIDSGLPPSSRLSSPQSRIKPMSTTDGNARATGCLRTPNSAARSRNQQIEEWPGHFSRALDKQNLGTVLVASTPSGSPSGSQEHLETQPEETHEKTQLVTQHGPSQESNSYQTSSPSSSYLHMYDRRSTEPEPTQVVEVAQIRRGCLPTQYLSGYTEENAAADRQATQPWDSEADELKPRASVNPRPRSLLDSLAAGKRERYGATAQVVARARDLGASAPPQAQSGPNSDTEPDSDSEAAARRTSALTKERVREEEEEEEEQQQGDDCDDDVEEEEPEMPLASVFEDNAELKGKGKGKAKGKGKVSVSRKTKVTSASAKKSENQQRGQCKAKATPKSSGRPKRNVTKSSRAEDDDDDDDDDDVEFAAGPSKKRKRFAGAQSPAPPKSVSASRTKKRARTESSPSNELTDLSAGTAIFTFWFQTSFYYVARVLCPSKEGKYKIRFADGKECCIGLRQMRLFQIRKGERILVTTKHAAAIALATVQSDAETVPVRMVASGKQLDVPMAMVHIDAVVYDSRRSVDADELKFCQVSAKQASCFAGCVFLFTLVDDVKKKKISDVIWEQGGTVCAEWPEVIAITEDRKPNRIVLQQQQISPNIPLGNRLFVLSEQAVASSKYMFALALGVPCLHVDVIEAIVDARSFDVWTKYLLPAGLSEMFGCSVTQVVDPEWNAAGRQFKQIMSNPVAFKVFADQRVLCVASEVFRDNHVHKDLPHILLASGASYVEVVRDAKYVKAEYDEFDYVVSITGTLPRGVPDDLSVVSWDWIKDSLISRTVGPMEVDSE
ncbi:unnamed protein product [Mycena citricolor]|uniref:BRCT domain-containing protein n=1 Tax=Mycena citricolor TaxID=2018698 RepID=A0AAD2HPA7_9AGAR|nr:unnamed protein product [Mycena citricolor]